MSDVRVATVLALSLFALPGLTADHPFAADENVCGYFSNADIAKIVGSSVRNGEKWGIAAGCEWTTAAGVTVQIVLVREVRYWENLAKSTRGQALPGHGKEAFVAPWLGEVRAGALTDKGAIYTMSKSRSTSVALLKLAIEKIPPN